MIGQYLPQTNESATGPETFQFSELNKAIVYMFGSSLNFSMF